MLSPQHRDRNVTTDYCDVTSPHVLTSTFDGDVLRERIEVACCGFSAVYTREEIAGTILTTELANGRAC